ncbi:monovalent cation/H+ antiporter subunit D [Sulfurivermis fontis]|uniref:monovalent cation/H+ antiporter subunit D n=1 Tax=Sulfurivermis fontis TaxID=1972068 RepID=UPI000FD7CA68|nr:monovalent cation/H+ antiporter subunit D [Sulfurivermis fontis]
MNHWIIAPLVLPLVAGMLSLLLVARPGLQRALSVGATAGLLPVTLLLLCFAGNGEFGVYPLGNWPAPFGIVLVLDRLTALMLLLTAVLALLVLLHAVNGDDRRGRDFHVLFQLQLLGINGAFLTGDLFNLFVFFEILLIASYGLALHGGGPERTRAGLHYVVLNLIGSALFLIAVGTLYAVTGTLNMADLAVKVAAAPLENAGLLRAAALLLLAVFGLKAALLPLHLWLPALYGHATAPVAALFAIMTKVGVYAILRSYTLIFPANGAISDVGAWLLPLALLTLAAGAVGVLGSQRLRVLIAYLVVVSVGTLLAGIGLFNSGGIGAALYYLPHTTLVSAGLFLLADLIARQRGVHGDHFVLGPPLAQPTRLGVLFFLGAVAAAGLPPLSGFLGKLLLLQAVAPAQAGWLWSIVLIGSLAGLIALSRVGSRIFWKTAGDRAVAGQAPLTHLAPAAVLLAMSIAMTVFAAPLIRYTEATAAQLLAPQQYINAVLGVQP